jgi:hypothetical protein
LFIISCNLVTKPTLEVDSEGWCGVLYREGEDLLCATETHRVILEKSTETLMYK